MVHRETARILVISGPKGGCGKTLFATSLARALAACNKPCLLVDMSSALHSSAIALNMRPEVFSSANARLSSSTWGDAARVQPVSRSEGGLSVFPTPYASLDYMADVPDMDESRITSLKNAPYEYIVVDMPPGIVCPEILYAADMAFLLATPEPDAIYACTQWLRQMLENRLVREGFGSCLEEDWSYPEILRATGGHRAADLEYAVMARRVFFVLNGRREGSEDYQSDALCHAWGCYLGADVRWMGSLHFEERRWFYTRRCSSDDPLLQDDSIQAEVMQIANKVMSPNFEKRRCLGSLNAIRNAVEFLTVAPDEKPRHAYRRLYEGYRRDNGLVSWGIPEDLIRMTMTQLDAAWQHIHNGSSVIPFELPQPVAPTPDFRVSRKLADNFSAVSDYEPSQSDLNAGSWLQQCRENAGMTVAMLSVRTRISPRLLEQIERRELSSFSPAHLQAYLFEIAKALALPLDEVRKKFGFK